MLFPKATRGFEPISYRGVLVSTLLHAIVYVVLYNMLNALIQFTNKMGLHKEISVKTRKNITIQRQEK
jgi:hypothetical protein